MTIEGVPNSTQQEIIKSNRTIIQPTESSENYLKRPMGKQNKTIELSSFNNEPKTSKPLAPFCKQLDLIKTLGQAKKSSNSKSILDYDNHEKNLNVTETGIPGAGVQKGFFKESSKLYLKKISIDMVDRKKNSYELFGPKISVGTLNKKLATTDRTSQEDSQVKANCKNSSILLQGASNLT